MAKLSKLIFVSLQGTGKEKYLIAGECPVNVIEDDGPTIVGTYKLIGKRKLIKGMIEVPKKVNEKH